MELCRITSRQTTKLVAHATRRGDALIDVASVSCRTAGRRELLELRLLSFLLGLLLEGGLVGDVLLVGHAAGQIRQARFGQYALC